MGLKIGKFLGNVAKTVFRATPIGAVASTAIDAVTTISRGLGGRALPPAQGPAPLPGLPIPNPFGSGGINPFPMGPLGPDLNPNRFPVPMGGGVMSPLGTTAMVPKGYHVNKLLVRAQVLAQNGRPIPPGLQRRIAQIVNTIVRNRHINSLNPRALRRADTRAHGFLRAVRHMVRYYQPKAKKGRAYVATRRKRR